MDNSKQEQNVEQIILDIEQQLFDSIKRKDTKSLESLLADDFVHRKPDGASTDKREFLKNVAELSVEVTSVNGSHQSVDVYGDVAVLTGVQNSTWRQAEEEGSSSGAFTDVFVRRGDAWLVVLAYDVDLAD